ncbi:hypothetical protein CFBP4996_19655 [Agrobacterium leguminum]|uniref:Uncharacterized protein n=1 Tax=Agrobacterium deltaense NCPPB 1641 TaxID=1183425 RepID=A0A1S7TW68_9HYPH|nr:MULTISPECIES: hypothetical protein [Agrobacterium]WFS68233.1 hypothetical protein CFBP4996_19655 [Agrobacterium leguminum]CVI58806.1 conserved hypothetical protein [Agrobacterium deltaense NCPPB 1641]
MSKNASITEAQNGILERLIEAFETDIALPVRVGPKAFGSSMPDYIHTPAENFAREREDIAEGGQWKKDMVAAERRRTERRAKCSRERISRMEEAFDWIRRFIWDDDVRQVLLAYAEVKARGWDWSRYLTNRNRRNPQKKAWVKRTVQRWIVRSLQTIESNIHQSGAIWSLETGLQVAHDEAKHTGKSIRSGLRSWTSPEEMPAA